MTSARLIPLLFAALLALAPSLHAAETKRPNVLFIAIDDLNHWVGHLGRNPQTRTPNIDCLAKQGVTFSRAYCTAPACNPSRASLMSGLRPSSTGCYLNSQPWGPGISKDKLLNTHFAQHGYRVFGAGKIYHSSERAGTWTGYHSGGKDGGARQPLKLHPSAKNDGVDGIKFGPLANADEDMPDHAVVDYCIGKLNEKGDQPFFIACGLVKPHMPFSVPKKWFDMFPLESIQLPPHRPDDLDDIPPAGIKMAGPQGDHAAIVRSGRWKEAVQAYLATIAYCDFEIGRLLDALDKSPQRDNTIVCLWSDHGWSLGEKSHWRKFALWEEPTRTVHVWRVPGVTPAGATCARTVDYVNIFPTLCQLTGLPKPAHLEGHDMTALLRNPQTAWSHPAIATHGLKNHTVRTEGWRFIRYADGGEELYDETADPLEYTNLAQHTDHAARKAELAKLLPKSDAPNLPATGGGGEGEAKPGKKKAKKQ
jgi:arylsulfatase A-like enzyme